MDDGELIERLSQFRFLYDKRDVNFKNKIKRENAWQTIGVIVGFTPTECEQRWVVLRNKYATLRKTSKNRPSGSAPYTISWPYYSLMSFLDPYMQQRRTTTNFSVADASSSPSTSNYSGVHHIIDESEVDEGGSEILVNSDCYYKEIEEQAENIDDTQELYENFIKSTPPAKKYKATTANPILESQVINMPKNVAEIKRLRSVKKNQSIKDSDGIVNKLGGCLSSFEKFIETKATLSHDDEYFVKGLCRDLSVFTPAEKISLKKQFYECMEKKVQEKHQ